MEKIADYKKFFRSLPSVGMVKIKHHKGCYIHVAAVGKMEKV